MRLVIGTLPDTIAASLLADDLILSGCPANRFLVLSSDGHHLERKRPNKPSLAPLCQHRGVWLWAVHEPFYYTGRVRDRGQQRQLYVGLIERIVASGVAGAWHLHQDAIQNGRLVSIVHLDQKRGSQTEFSRIVLAHATRRMQVSDLIDVKQGTTESIDN